MIQREQFDIPAKTYDDKPFTLRAVRLLNAGRQPLILWEGFFQNGIFYDLLNGNGSIGEYINSSGYDVWIINSRGNGGSTGKHYATSMDDFAAFDIPAVIDFVNQKTKLKPIYIGHSQGGNTALISMMGACRTKEGSVYLSEDAAHKRQNSLKALVTLGSFLDFKFSSFSSLQNFVRNGVVLKLFCFRFRIISSSSLLKLLKIFKRIPVPVPISLRQAIIKNKFLRILLFPLTIILNFVSLMGTWSFLYHIQNVSKESRLSIFYKTMEATYWGILAQYQRAVLYEKMVSLDDKVNYSEHYDKIKLPVSIVTMEYDTMADPTKTEKIMFAKIGSKEKYYTEWMGQGHEDFVMNPNYFHQLLDAIKIIG